VVRAAAASAIPLISAVGHETDTTLLDFVADMRAPTPSAAAELAVPVRAELLSQILNLQRRMLGCFTRSVEQRRRHLAQLARVLPRPEQLFAAPRQKLDVAGERLGTGLRHNLQKHRAHFLKSAALLRPQMMRQRFARARARLESLTRLIEGISYRAVLERGFALVRGEDGKVRRRAGALKSGEALTLTFADGESQAVAGAKPKAKKSPADQGSLF